MFPNKRYNRKPPFNRATNNSQKKIEPHHFEISPCYGYFGYQLYFMDKDSDVDTILKNVCSFESYIHRNKSQFSLAKIKENLAFVVDLKTLTSDEEFDNEWVGFKEDIIEKTEFCLSCMGLAMHQTVLTEFMKPSIEEADGPLNVFHTLRVVRCRLSGHEPIVGIKNLRVSSYGKLISVRGTIIKRSMLKLQCQYLVFSCSSCGGSQAVKQADGVFTVPFKCTTKYCRAESNFVPLYSSPNIRTINSQTLKLQELVGEDSDDIGRVPRTIECELTDDLVGHCTPGDDVTITGVVKVRNTNEVYSGKNKQPSIFLLYVDAVSITNDKNHSSPGMHPGINFCQKDYYAIQKIHSEQNLFRLLVQSLCPSIYGHEIVKAGLLLALFGGTKTEDMIRSDSHVIVVGDPGLGKSQLLQACSNVVPRGVYVCGNTSTTSGLTVTMTKEGGGDYSLEAGALMLADQGCCCIDEFDKMTGQHDCLLEVMEQQHISISKAGIHCSLPTRVSILAAANPVGGHYNKAKTVAENLKMGSPLLSRFDLVFILLDKQDEQLDALLSEHVLALHSGRKKTSSCGSSVFSETQTQSTRNLKNKLGIQRDEIVDHLPHVLFRKYIAYAQKHVHPLLNREAQKVLMQFYLELRKTYHRNDATPVTARQLQSLLRLTQARAKLELREEATADDAIDVVEIMRHSLVDIFSDDTGSLDFTRSQNGSGISNRKLVIQFLKTLQHKSETIGRTIFNKKELEELSNQLGIGDFNRVMDSLNGQGFLLKKTGGNFQLCSGES